MALEGLRRLAGAERERDHHLCAGAAVVDLAAHVRRQLRVADHEAAFRPDDPADGRTGEEAARHERDPEHQPHRHQHRRLERPAADRRRHDRRHRGQQHEHRRLVERGAAQDEVVAVVEVAGLEREDGGERHEHVDGRELEVLQQRGEQQRERGGERVGHDQGAPVAALAGAHARQRPALGDRVRRADRGRSGLPAQPALAATALGAAGGVAAVRAAAVAASPLPRGIVGMDQEVECHRVRSAQGLSPQRARPKPEPTRPLRPMHHSPVHRADPRGCFSPRRAASGRRRPSGGSAASKSVSGFHPSWRSALP